MAELTQQQRQELARQQAHLCSRGQLQAEGQPITQERLDACDANVASQYLTDLGPKHEPKAGYKDAACFVANEIFGTELGGLCPSSAGIPSAGTSPKR
ncbi:MAG: hypothetical protein U1E36_09120 [Rickettsiales bacterium]